MPQTLWPVLRYIFDPLCGWCYAAAPALSTLEQECDVTIKLHPWGLFSGPNVKQLSSEVARYIWSNDERIGQMTGLAFSADYRSKVLGDRNGRLDSTLSTRALTMLQTVDSRPELGLLHRMQRARYAEGRDLTNPLVLAELVAEFGGEKHEIARRLVEDRTLADLTDERIGVAKALMRQLDASGVPLIVLDTGRSKRILQGASLYRGPTAISAEIAAVISSEERVRI